MASEAGGAAENIRVVCRFRPFNAREKSLQSDGSTDTLRFDSNGRSFWVGPDKAAGNYSMDAVLLPEASQDDMYQQASGIVDAVLKGYNGTILAYGQARCHLHPVEVCTFCAHGSRCCLTRVALCTDGIGEDVQYHG